MPIGILGVIFLSQAGRALGVDSLLYKRFGDTVFCSGKLDPLSGLLSFNMIVLFEILYITASLLLAVYE